MPSRLIANAKVRSIPMAATVTTSSISATSTTPGQPSPSASNRRVIWPRGASLAARGPTQTGRADGLLGEGRNFFIYVSSDWHNRGAGGARDSFTTGDFIPGEYTKLYVPNTEGFRAQSIIDGMRSGNSYSVNADIIGPDLVFRAKAQGDDWKTMGETLVARAGGKVK